MPPSGDRISDEAARAIWRRAAQLQAEAERRLEERTRQIPVRHAGESSEGEGLRPDEVRLAAEEAGIAPEFVQIALAEAAAAPDRELPETRWDLLGAKLFLGSTRRSIEVTAIVPGNLDTVSAASLQVFAGHPCLLQTGEVAEIPSSSHARTTTASISGASRAVTAATASGSSASSRCAAVAGPLTER